MQQDMTNRYAQLRQLLRYEYFSGSVNMYNTIRSLAEMISSMESDNDDNVSVEARVLTAQLADISVCLYTGALNRHEAYLLTNAKIDTFIEQVLRPHIISTHGVMFDDHTVFKKNVIVGKA